MTVNSVIVGTIVLKIFSPPYFCGTTTHTLYYGYVLLIQVVYNGEVKTKISRSTKGNKSKMDRRIPKSKTQRQNYKKLGGPEKIHLSNTAERGQISFSTAQRADRERGGHIDLICL